MNDKPLKILLVEENDDDVEAFRRALQALGSSHLLEVVTTLAQAQAHLKQYTPDVVICNLVLPDGEATDVLKTAGADLPFPLVIMTSRGDEQVAVEAIKAGALDYVVKSSETFAEIPHIIKRALREWHEMSERKLTRKALEKRTVELNERIKELNCLFGIEGLSNDEDVSLDQVIKGIVHLLPNAWQYPEITCARATIDGQEFTTDNFSESTWKQLESIHVHGRPVGTLEVYYLEERPDEAEGPFLREERTLIKAISSRLGRIIQHKRAEKDLLQSEQRFRAIFEGAKEAFFLKDHDLRYTHVNPAFCDLMGVPTPEILGRKATDLYDEESGKHIEERDSRALAGERIEMEHTRPIRGTLMTFHDTIVPLRDSKNNIVGVCGIARDITERSRILTNAHPPSEASSSPAMQATLDSARIAANTDSIVLLQGESGSGKDHLARWLHQHSRRASGPFFSVNCAAIAKELAESELFGHERGAFTGATGRKKGMFELAEGGTILLNEIGELDLSLQSKLLAFLDTQSFLRVGGEKHVQIDARLIAATHRNLETEVAEGRFLEPLFYRLSVFPVRVPSLRERTEDIPGLVDVILSGLAKEMQLTEIPLLRRQHMEILSQYPWPGNVRELRNVLERSLMLWRGGEFGLAMPISRTEDAGLSHTVRYVPGKTIRDVTNEVKSFMCAAAMEACQGNKKEAAKLLGISRDAFYRHIKHIK